MVDIKSLLTVLKLLMLVGLIATIVMMTAVVYRKLKKKYPVQVEEHKWIFSVVAGLMALILFWMYQKFVAPI